MPCAAILPPLQYSVSRRCALRRHPPSAVYPLVLLAVGEAAEWHLSSELALAPRQGEFIWFDMWCAAHIFTGARVVEPRA